MNLWERAARSITLGPPSEYRPDLGPCWLSSLSGSHGYATIKDGDTKRRVHRVVYERLIGPIPSGLEPDHLCRVRRCVCPFHLEPVPQRVNLLRGESFSAVNARKTVCPLGHPYDDANTYRPPGKQGRMCRTCARTKGIQKRRAIAAIAPKTRPVVCVQCREVFDERTTGRLGLYCSALCKSRYRRRHIPLAPAAAGLGD